MGRGKGKRGRGERAEGRKRRWKKMVERRKGKNEGCERVEEGIERRWRKKDGEWETVIEKEGRGEERRKEGEKVKKSQ